MTPCVQAGGGHLHRIPEVLPWVPQRLASVPQSLAEVLPRHPQSGCQRSEEGSEAIGCRPWSAKLPCFLFAVSN